MRHIAIQAETEGALVTVVDRYLATLEAAGQPPPPDHLIEQVVINSLIVSLAASYADEGAHP